MWTKWIKFVKLVTDGPMVHLTGCSFLPMSVWEYESGSKWTVQKYERFCIFDRPLLDFGTVYFSNSEPFAIVSRPLLVLWTV